MTLIKKCFTDKIKKSAPSRIVNVSSHGHKFAKVDFDIFKMPKAMSDFRTYCLSKLANIYFTKELAKKLQGTGNLRNNNTVFTIVCVFHLSKIFIFNILALLNSNYNF